MTMKPSMLSKAFTIIGIICLTACTHSTTHSYQTPEPPKSSAGNFYSPAMSELSIKAYTYMLADELTSMASANQLRGKVAVTSFVDQNTREVEVISGHPLSQLAEQLEAGFIYELNKRGFAVIDFKVRPSILVTEKGDLIWSRDQSELVDTINARYLLSGTLNEHENGAIVNVRMIDINNHQVIASAQGFVPNNVFWSSQDVTSRDGYLMHNGERRRSY